MIKNIHQKIGIMILAILAILPLASCHMDSIPEPSSASSSSPASQSNTSTMPLGKKQFKNDSLGIEFSYPSDWADPEVDMSGTRKNHTESWAIYFGPDCGIHCDMQPFDSKTPLRSGVFLKQKVLPSNEDLELYTLSGVKTISDTSKNGIRIIETEFTGGPPPYGKTFFIVTQNALYSFSPEEPYFQPKDITDFLSNLVFLK
jgi:hypothetical protein